MDKSFHIKLDVLDFWVLNFGEGRLCVNTTNARAERKRDQEQVWDEVGDPSKLECMWQLGMGVHSVICVKHCPMKTRYEWGEVSKREVVKEC